MATAAAPTLFERIVRGEIPSKRVYEDEHVLAFRDVSPCAKTHVLVVPKVLGNLSQLQHAKESDKPLLGHLLWAAGHVARQEGLQEGYRVVRERARRGTPSCPRL